MNIKEQLKEIINQTIKEIGVTEEVNINIEIPKNKEHGDYSSNIALTLTRVMHMAPMEIGDILKDKIKHPLIKKVELVLPGFLNFYIENEVFLNNINNILEEKKNYGRSNYGNNQKYNLEYLSANPTGIMHVGHGRGATYGDTLSRILSFIGYQVTREYFINDAGNQMYNMGLSIKERYKECCGLECNIPEGGYHGQEITAIAKAIKEEYQDNKLNEEVEFFKQYGLKILLDQIKKDLDKYRVNFDVWTSEQSLYDTGKVEDTISKLKNGNYCYVNDGALWLKTSDFGDEKDRVMIKSDGNYTYFLPDIAYHADKINRGFDHLITILGSDHHGTTQRVIAGLQMLGYDTSILEYKLLQMVRIIKNGEELKLSKRTGKTITLNDIIDEVGINATRYFFTSKSLDTQMDFNLDLASSETSDNPVYYIEYANARICSILKKYSKKVNLKSTYQYLNNEDALNILKKLYEFKGTVESAGIKKAPHILTTYIYDLATLFHNYYSKHQIITDNNDETEENIIFLLSIRMVLNNGLNLLGIIPREEM